MTWPNAACPAAAWTALCDPCSVLEVVGNSAMEGCGGEMNRKCVEVGRGEAHERRGCPHVPPSSWPRSDFISTVGGLAGLVVERLSKNRKIEKSKNQKSNPE